MADKSPDNKSPDKALKELSARTAIIDNIIKQDIKEIRCRVAPYNSTETEISKGDKKKIDMIKNMNECSPIVKLIVEWCIDDNGINVLYKNNGIERYPEFKLYKMISRCVHNHTPQAQLERKEFSKFLVSNKNVSKNEYVIDIDSLPSYI